MLVREGWEGEVEGWIRLWVGPRHHVLDGVQITHGNEQF